MLVKRAAKCFKQAAELNNNCVFWGFYQFTTGGRDTYLCFPWAPKTPVFFKETHLIQVCYLQSTSSLKYLSLINARTPGLITVLSEKQWMSHFTAVPFKRSMCLAPVCQRRFIRQWLGSQPCTGRQPRLVWATQPCCWGKAGLIKFSHYLVFSAACWKISRAEIRQIKGWASTFQGLSCHHCFH